LLKGHYRNPLGCIVVPDYGAGRFVEIQRSGRQILPCRRNVYQKLSAAAASGSGQGQDDLYVVENAKAA